MNTTSFSLPPSASGSRFSSVTSNRSTSFFTPSKIDHRLTESGHSKRSAAIFYLKSFASIESSLSKFILAPTVRTRLTNFVFFAAFSSACVCVGARSLFPNYGFHSNSEAGKLKRSRQQASDPQLLSSTPSTVDDRREIPRCPLPFLHSQSVSEQPSSGRRQRRWLEEQAP
ncbi:hypothetical protein CROQUDRAFT_665592 [Cronartium quercuum f. sp. fusiforme G11]|uniref:Uncharacterized protein n=1 Tax=Cronartium quercuum f. sp. fusiforme G11 TaxID=708437 RepID=A0A9P6NA71_9BASI|nr:hypothetical protein CROQUDRAFT_665592 [Cronartium quercuum f. sp. fusiforme G11]